MKNRFLKSSRRLDRLEAALGKRSQPQTSLYHRVVLEAEQELSPDELRLYKSASAAQSEGRFHSLEEHTVSQKFQRLREAVAQRYGTSYGGLLYDCIREQSKPKRSAKDFEGIGEALNWGRDNGVHVRRLLKAQEESRSSITCVSVVAADPSSGSRIEH